jgi:hypothetical protein
VKATDASRFTIGAAARAEIDVAIVVHADRDFDTVAARSPLILRGVIRVGKIGNNSTK